MSFLYVCVVHIIFNKLLFKPRVETNCCYGNQLEFGSRLHRNICDKLYANCFIGNLENMLSTHFPIINLWDLLLNEQADCHKNTNLNSLNLRNISTKLSSNLFSDFGNAFKNDHGQMDLQADYGEDVRKVIIRTSWAKLRWVKYKDFIWCCTDLGLMTH